MEATLDCDVLVVGAGAAGLRAAIEASAAGARTAVACKSLLGKAGTVLERGGIACASKEAAERVAELESWGALLERAPQSLVAHRDDRTGQEVLRALQHEVLRRGIEVHMECAIHRLLLDAGRVVGAFGIRRPSGGFVHFRSRAVILATGGCGRAWRDDASPADATGDGHALALDAGARLANKDSIFGVRVDPESAASGIPGLYAAGDVAAGDGLSDALVSGRRAGLHAARYSRTEHGRNLIDVGRLSAIGRQLLAPLERKGGENPYAVLVALQDARTLEEIRILKTRVANASAPGPRAYNPAWQLALELRALLVVSEKLIERNTSWLARKPRSASGAATRAAASSKNTG